MTRRRDCKPIPPKQVWDDAAIKTVQALFTSGLSAPQVHKYAPFNQISISVFYRNCERYSIDITAGVQLREPHRQRVSKDPHRRSDFSDESSSLIEYGPRACYRPPVKPHTSLTARLFGDPQPGRTPWAA